MTKFRISTSKENLDTSVEVAVLLQQENITVEGTENNVQWKNKQGDQFVLIGEVIGQRKGNIIDTKNIDYSLLEEPDQNDQFEGRYLIVKIEKNTKLTLWTDYFGRVDVYWFKNELGDIYICSGKELFPESTDFGSIDQNALAQMLTIYGGRPLKKHTLHKNLKRLGVNERLMLNNDNLSIIEREFIPHETFPKDDATKLEEYTDIFVEAVRARASENQNIVFLSSGWDSTSILATLCHLFDTSKIECIIGRMKYSKRSEVINQFELDRAQKMAEYYGVKLHVIDLDYTEEIEDKMKRLSPILRSQEFSVLTGFNHWLLAQGAAKIAQPGAVVFAGEISDGAHNLGFSQYFSIYHPASHAFREYSDKMACYLFGPTFLDQLIKGKHKNDPVWKIFMQYHESTILDELEQGEEAITAQLLSTFFLSGGRIPLFSRSNFNLLTEKGQKLILEEGNKTYLEKFKGKINGKNIYSHYLHLYHSFHWQGGTVATLEHACEAFDLKCRLPFLDKALIDFLSQMPESWGRGLDINNTKYPLKWMLTNRIDYPMHYQEGPHSYLYDVNPSFSHADGVVNSSLFTHYYRNALSSKDDLKYFDSEYFDIEYIDKIISKYCAGESVYGQELIDISILGNLFTIDHLQ